MLNQTSGETIDQLLSRIEGPAWHNQSEYPGLDSNEFGHDRHDVEVLLEKIEKSTQPLKPFMSRVLEGGEHRPLDLGERDGLISGLQAIAELEEQAQILLQNLITYVQCESCIDSKNDRAQKLNSELETLEARLENALKPSALFLERAPEDLLNRYLEHPHTKPQEFKLRHARKLSATLLSEAEETLITSLRAPGFTAWNNLYDQIAGHLSCSLEPDSATGGLREEIGLAQASGLLRDASESKRRRAWNAIQSAWREHEQAGAAILNGLAGWRLEVNKRRSHTRPLHFLDQPLHAARISRDTLEAMFSAVRGEIEVPRRALRAIARGLGKTQVDPWDLLAPAPVSGHGGRRPYRQGLTLVREAFHGVDASLGDFVDSMEKNWWIEGRVLPNKAQGAFSTEFLKTRTPRVFQTYMGSLEDITTLAHELGHAYHSWVMRDLPLAQRHYPKTLAETASVFAETALADHLLATGSEQVRFEMAWTNAASAAAYLLDIPARFEFERNFYERRQHGFVPPQELSELTENAWRNWYGDTLTRADRRYWLSKLHFSLAGTSFYNFPYTFGYLFSLGIYALRAKKGTGFTPAYVSLLRDTGRMTAEELVKTHLGEDITQPQFWKKSLRIVEGQVRQLEDLLIANRSSWQ